MNLEDNMCTMVDRSHIFSASPWIDNRSRTSLLKGLSGLFCDDLLRKPIVDSSLRGIERDCHSLGYSHDLNGFTITDSCYSN